MSRKSSPAFFVGYANPPPELSRFLLTVMLCVPVFALCLALVLGIAVQDRGGGRYTGDARATGVIANLPYPVLMTAPAPGYPEGHAILIAGGGKNGAGSFTGKLEGATVSVNGFGLKRGTLDMIVADEESQISTISPANAGSIRTPLRLGRYTLQGEICDGKCYPGGMRPGTGLAHKACANLCILGGQPAVFATQSPVEGQSFLLLANADGGLPPPVLHDWTGLPVELTGDIYRIGDLLIFRANWAGIRKP